MNYVVQEAAKMAFMKLLEPNLESICVQWSPSILTQLSNLNLDLITPPIRHSRVLPYSCLLALRSPMRTWCELSLPVRNVV